MQHSGTPKGWVEVLFNLSASKPTPFIFSDLTESEYMMVGSPMPIQELDGPYDLYQILHENKLHKQPRAVRSFDMLNVVQRGCPILTMLILSPHQDRQFVADFRASNGGKCRIEIWPQFPHGLVQLPAPFPSFSGRIRS